MKLPKEVRRYNPVLKKHTVMKVVEAKKKSPNATHTMSRGSKGRVSSRQKWKDQGSGNAGKTSRPPVKKRKMSGKKLSKKTDLRFVCKESGKTFVQKSGIRSKKVEFV